MNKSDLVNAIVKEAGMAKADAKKALDATLEAVGEALKNNEKIAIAGFGTFEVVGRPERKGINPRTKEAITIPAKKAVKFKAGSQLNAKVK